MSALAAAVMLGVSVGLITNALWPRKREAPRRFEFVEDSRVPRTLH